MSTSLERCEGHMQPPIIDQWHSGTFQQHFARVTLTLCLGGRSSEPLVFAPPHATGSSIFFSRVWSRLEAHVNLLYMNTR